MVQRARRPLADRLLESGWLAIALGVPLAINPWGQSIFALPKAALLRTASHGDARGLDRGPVSEPLGRHRQADDEVCRWRCRRSRFSL